MLPSQETSIPLSYQHPPIAIINVYFPILFRTPAISIKPFCSKNVPLKVPGAGKNLVINSLHPEASNCPYAALHKMVGREHGDTLSNWVRELFCSLNLNKTFLVRSSCKGRTFSPRNFIKACVKVSVTLLMFLARIYDSI